MNKELKMGIKSEAEHAGTIKYIEKYFRKHGRFPKIVEVQKKVAMDHLKEDKHYYTKLRKYKL